VDAADEAELLAKAQNGDQDAFMKLVEREVPRLKRKCCHILKNEFDAEDALQEAQLKAWERRFGCRESFPAWFYKITKNAALDMYRQAYRRRQAPLELADIPDFSVPFDDRMIWGHDLREVIASLSPEERMLLELHYFDGYQLNQIAEIMEVEYAAIRQRSSRLEEKIRRILRPDYLSGNS
jgi:RNA polymerase sigma-70 factor (ECF subfamily)